MKCRASEMLSTSHDSVSIAEKSPPTPQLPTQSIITGVDYTGTIVHVDRARLFGLIGANRCPISRQLLANKD